MEKPCADCPYRDAIEMAQLRMGGSLFELVELVQRMQTAMGTASRHHAALAQTVRVMSSDDGDAGS